MIAIQTTDIEIAGVWHDLRVEMDGLEFCAYLGESEIGAGEVTGPEEFRWFNGPRMPSLLKARIEDLAWLLAEDAVECLEAAYQAAQQGWSDNPHGIPEHRSYTR